MSSTKDGNGEGEHGRNRYGNLVRLRRALDKFRQLDAEHRRKAGKTSAPQALNQGIMLHHLQLFLAVASEGETTSKELAQICDLAQSTVSRFVLAFDEEYGIGLISRGKDPHDRRRDILFLSGRGRTLAREIAGMLE